MRRTWSIDLIDIFISDLVFVVIYAAGALGVGAIFTYEFRLIVYIDRYYNYVGAIKLK